MKKVKTIMLCSLLAIGMFVFAACGTVDASSGNWTAWAVTTEATCTTTGVETRTNTKNSSKTETRAIPALGHNYGEGEVKQEPTFFLKGEMQISCTRCDHEETVDIDKLTVSEVLALNNEAINDIYHSNEGTHDTEVVTEAAYNSPFYTPIRTGISSVTSVNLNGTSLSHETSHKISVGYNVFVTFSQYKLESEVLYIATLLLNFETINGINGNIVVEVNGFSRTFEMQMPELQKIEIKEYHTKDTSTVVVDSNTGDVTFNVINGNRRGIIGVEFDNDILTLDTQIFTRKVMTTNDGPAVVAYDADNLRWDDSSNPAFVGYGLYVFGWDNAITSGTEQVHRHCEITVYIIGIGYANIVFDAYWNPAV